MPAPPPRLVAPAPPALPPVELRAAAPLLTPLLPPLLRALDAVGLGAVGPAAVAPAAPAAPTIPEPTGVVVLVHDGAPAPDAADDLVRGSRPHLLVGLGARHVDLGPFVDPGLTACLHCLFASAAPAVLALPTGALPPASLVAVAAAFLAHDVRRWAGGHEPATWSATVRIGADLAVGRHSWLRHPQCGCTWSLPA